MKISKKNRKVSVTFSIDHQILIWLEAQQIKNKSELVNDFLNSYLKNSLEKNTPKEIDELEKEHEEAERRYIESAERLSTLSRELTQAREAFEKDSQAFISEMEAKSDFAQQFIRSKR